MDGVVGTERTLQPRGAERVSAVALEKKQVSICAEDVGGIENRLEIEQALMIASGALIVPLVGQAGLRGRDPARTVQHRFLQNASVGECVGEARSQRHWRLHNRVADNKQAVPRTKRVIPVGTPTVRTMTKIGARNVRPIDVHACGRKYVA